MQTQTQVMVRLVRQGVITREDAIQWSNKQDELIRML
jgi:Tfp pilus assembly pilus retraction ATPase PilT